MNSMNLGLAGAGDFQQGGAYSAQDRAGSSQADLDTTDSGGANVAPGMVNHPTGHPIFAFFAVALIAVLIKWGFDRLRKPGEQPGFVELFLVGMLLVILQLNFAKWIAGSWQIPGFTDLALAA